MMFKRKSKVAAPEGAPASEASSDSGSAAAANWESNAAAPAGADEPSWARHGGASTDAPPLPPAPGAEAPEERPANAGPDGAPPGDPPAPPPAPDAADAALGELPPPALADHETRELLKTLKKQQKKRIEQALAEAEDMERRAHEMTREAKKKQKIRAEYTRHSDYVKEIAPELGFDPDRPITVISPLPSDDQEQVEFATIQEGRSYVRVVYDKGQNQYTYEVVEPELSVAEAEILDFLRDTLVRTLDGRSTTSDEDWEAYLTDSIERAILDHSILVDEVSKQRLEYYLVRDFLGYGPIDVMMRDPMIEDISCDGPDIPLYIFHRQYESIRSNVRFPDEHGLDSFVIRLAQKSGKHISIAEPLLDATLPDTSRLQASLSKEVTTRGSSFTIRKFRSDPLTPPDLVRLGTMSSQMAAFFWLTMEEGHSLIYAGGTASGKTTSLNAVCQFIPPQKKVVSIEDTREINLVHENWIAGLTRSGFGSEMTAAGKPAGAIDMYRLLEAALRQRPEFLLVGEVRGPEALTLFQAMATGHATYSTLHADSVMSAVYRLENPPINVPRIMLQTLDAVAIQTQVRINQRMVRRVRELTEIVGIDPETGDLLTNTVFVWDPATDAHRFLGKSHVLDRIAEKNNLAPEMVDSELKNRTLIVEWMVEKGIRRISDVADVIRAYYNRPEDLLAKVRGQLRAPAITGG